MTLLTSHYIQRPSSWKADFSRVSHVTLRDFLQEEEEEELQVGWPGVNEGSFHARPHHNVHCTLGVDAVATGPLFYSKTSHFKCKAGLIALKLKVLKLGRGEAESMGLWPCTSQAHCYWEQFHGASTTTLLLLLGLIAHAPTACLLHRHCETSLPIEWVIPLLSLFRFPWRGCLRFNAGCRVGLQLLLCLWIVLWIGRFL